MGGSWSNRRRRSSPTWQMWPERGGPVRDVVVISDFHADHTFGWPFLLLELMRRCRRSPVFVVGPPGIDARLAEMMYSAGCRMSPPPPSVSTCGTWRSTVSADCGRAPLPRREGRACAPPSVLRGPVPAGYLDAWVLRRHEAVPGPRCGRGPRRHAGARVQRAAPGLPVHMDVDDVADLRKRFPDVRLVLTHLGGVDELHIADCVVPSRLRDAPDLITGPSAGRDRDLPVRPMNGSRSARPSGVVAHEATPRGERNAEKRTDYSSASLPACITRGRLCALPLPRPSPEP
jgi:hypothetical protein